MDDIIDLEIDKINLILDKISEDPETEEVKRTELNLWNKIKTKTAAVPKDRMWYYRRGRYACCLGSNLRHKGGDRIFY